MNGPFGNRFPYTNFHEMNLDWMIQIAKDFLDQYTNIQNVIEQGLTDLTDKTDTGLAALQEKYETLEGLLDSWYNEHSEDIAGQLADALEDLNTWYTTHEGYLDQYVTDSIGAFNTAAEAKAAETIASIPSDYTTLSNRVTALENYGDRKTSISATDFSNKLSKINIACIIPFTNSSGWTDLPSGITAGTFYNDVYDTNNHCVQTIVSYPAGKKYHRVTDYSLGTELIGWIEEMDYKNSTDTVLQRMTITPSDYDNKLCKVNLSGMFADDGTGWTDRPAGVAAGMVVNYRYSGFSFQTYTSYPARKYFVRVVSGAATPTKDWIEFCTNNDDYPHMMAVTPSDYSYYLSNIPGPWSFGFGNNSGWLDLPEGETATAGIISTYRYTSSYLVQTFTSYSDLRQWLRVISSYDHSVVQDWIGCGANDNSTIWYAIGDSITSGSYSNNDGEGVVATNAAWSYPNTVAKLRKCKVHNIAVPGAAITGMGSQASSVPSTATLVTITGGANDYAGNIPLGSASSSLGTDSVCGALKSMIETIAATAPNARIVLISPFIIKRGSSSSSWSLNYTGNAGFTYKQLSDAMKDIAELYNIDFINGTEKGPVNILNIGAVEKDNTHPTKDFYKTISQWVASKLF